MNDNNSLDDTQQQTNQQQDNSQQQQQTSTLIDTQQHQQQLQDQNLLNQQQQQQLFQQTQQHPPQQQFPYINNGQRQFPMMDRRYAQAMEGPTSDPLLVAGNQEQQLRSLSTGKKIQGSSTIFIGDIPIEVTQTELYQYLEQFIKSGSCDLILKRPPYRYFNYAFAKVNEYYIARHLAKDIRYPEIRGKQCRIMLLDVRRYDSKTSLFVKGFPKEWAHSDLYSFFQAFGEIESAKVSLDKEHTSRGYGFVQFQKEEVATTVLKFFGENIDDNIYNNRLPIQHHQNEEEKKLNANESFHFQRNFTNNQLLQNRIIEKIDKEVAKKLKVLPYKKDQNRGLLSQNQYNNLFVKHFPDPNISSEQLHDMFSIYGNIVSAVMIKKEDGLTNAGFGFVCFDNPESAKRAVDDLNGKDGLYVRRALKKQQRVLEIKKKCEKFKKSKAKFNLYVRNFPLDTTEDELRDFFNRFGEVQNIKIMRKVISQGNFEDIKNRQINFKSKSKSQSSNSYNDQQEEEEQKQSVIQNNNDQEISSFDDINNQQFYDKDSKQIDGKGNLQTEEDKENSQNQQEEEQKEEVKEKPQVYFSKNGVLYGESLGFGFVCYKTADIAAKVKLEVKTQLFKNQYLFVSQFETKAVRAAHLGEIRDKKQFEKYMNEKKEAASKQQDQQNGNQVNKKQRIVIPQILRRYTVYQFFQLLNGIYNLYGLCKKQNQQHQRQNQNNNRSGNRRDGGNNAQRRQTNPNNNQNVNVQQQQNQVQQPEQQQQQLQQQQQQQPINQQAVPMNQQMPQNQINYNQVQQQAIAPNQVVQNQQPAVNAMSNVNQQQQQLNVNQQPSVMNPQQQYNHNNQYHQRQPHYQRRNYYNRPPVHQQTGPMTADLIYYWGYLTPQQQQFIDKIMQRHFTNTGIRCTVNDGKPNNHIFKMDINHIVQSKDYQEATSIQDRRKLLGDIILDWVCCFVSQEWGSKIAGTILGTDEVNFNHCLQSLQTFKLKVNDAFNQANTEQQLYTNNPLNPSQIPMNNPQQQWYQQQLLQQQYLQQHQQQNQQYQQNGNMTYVVLGTVNQFVQQYPQRAAQIIQNEPFTFNYLYQNAQRQYNLQNLQQQPVQQQEQQLSSQQQQPIEQQQTDQQQQQQEDQQNNSGILSGSVNSNNSNDSIDQTD